MSKRDRPLEADLLLDHFTDLCAPRGASMATFQCGGIPVSSNHQYYDGMSFCLPGTPGSFQDRQGRWRVRNRKLTEEAKHWRMAMDEAVKASGIKWDPSGVTAAVILIRSPYWVTQRREVREKDIDNLTKPVLDAIQYATSIPDELHWNVHVFKMLSRAQMTTVHLFDLGDIVEYYY